MDFMCPHIISQSVICKNTESQTKRQNTAVAKVNAPDTKFTIETEVAFDEKTIPSSVSWMF